MWTYQDLLQLKNNENYLDDNCPLVDPKSEIIEHTYNGPLGNYPILSRIGSNDTNTVLAIIDGGGSPEYGFIPVEPNTPGSILDVGCYIGGFTRLAICSNQNRPIIAIEPMISNVAMIQRNIRQLPRNPKGNYLFNVAVGHSGHTFISGPPDDQVHRYMGNTSAAELSPSRSEVKSIDLDELLLLNEICTGTKEIFFMKIDCEGGEYPLFENASRENVRKIKYIVGEFHAASIETPHYMFLKHGYERYTITQRDANGLFAYKRIDTN